MATKMWGEARLVRPLVMLAAAVALALVAGCSTVGATKSDGFEDTSGSASPAVAKAKAALARGYEGDFEPAPTEGPAAQRGRDVWFISCGQAYYACSNMADAFQDAGTELGWQVSIKDGKADPNEASTIIRQAIAAKADAVALVTFDCPGIKSALQDARAAQMPAVNFGSIDCSDPVFGGKDGDLFTATVKLRGSDNNADFWKAWSAARANYVIAKSNGKANVLWVAEESQATHQYQDEAFVKQMKTCTTCTVTRAPFTFAQVPNPATLQWSAAIKSHPEANAVVEGIDALMQLGLQTAVKQSGRSFPMVGGGEGFPPNFDLIRSGDQTFSVALPYGWVMWGLADTLNRVFAGDDPAKFPSQGGGWQYIDAEHNLPAAGQPYTPKLDYQSAYRAIWSSTN